MINVTALKSSQGSAHYLTQDNYYLDKENVSAKFFGAGAKALSLLETQISNENLEALLSGKLPNGEELGTNGKHKPGWDVTFSAPKSLSIQALIAGDKRIELAHDKAVEVALSHYESHLTTRQRQNGHIEKHLTHSLVSAIFRHQTSRELDPQLHSHAVVLNITQKDDGSWRSVSSESLYKMQRELDEIYKYELESRVNELGYQTSKTDNGFEIKGIPQKTIDTFSKRSLQVEQELAKYNLSRVESTAEQRNIAALTTRRLKPKELNITHLQHIWMKELKTHNLQTIPVQDKPLKERHINLKQDVIHSINVLTEKDFVITESAIYRHFNTTHKHPISKETLANTLTELKEQKVVHQREVKQFDRHTKLKISSPGITTQKAIDLEKNMLDSAQKMTEQKSPSWIEKISNNLLKLVQKSGHFKNGAISSIKSATKQVDIHIALAANKGHHWTQEQRTATIGILSNSSKITQLQGLAGTAKTSSVLSSIRHIAKKSGYNVVAIAPSHSASRQLQKDIQADLSLTTSGYIAQMKNGQFQSQFKGGRVLIIHDEAGLASTKQMSELLALASKENHRVLNSGDRYQKASIGAGSAFGQLIDNQIPTFELNHIFRQKEEALKQAVGYSLPHKNNIQRAVQMLNKNGSIQQFAIYEERIQFLADKYASLSHSERQKTLLIDPTRKGVDELNLAVREKLIQKEELSSKGVQIQILKSREISQTDIKHGAVQSVYRIGDIITINSNSFKQQDIDLIKGSQWRVTGYHHTNNAIAVESANQPKSAQKTLSSDMLFKTHASVSEIESRQISTGDSIRFTSTDIQKGVLTNETATVTALDPSNSSMTLQKADGSEVHLNSNEFHHLDYNYAKTTFSAQGLTAKRVLYHAQSTSINLMNQRDFYVGLSRATHEIQILTDSKPELKNLIEKSSGEKMTAISPEKGNVNKERIL